jgi:hypothetical protein
MPIDCAKYGEFYGMGFQKTLQDNISEDYRIIPIGDAPSIAYCYVWKKIPA